ncbi:type II secretion system protein [Cryobacterium levicorallinum]|uniref:Type II secretion system protein n=1 Tax=Cryobacterium levicorallinum TaxID=995038 RepID=A0A1I3EEF7_9MICO|nr:type II secretion system protein [Cryobacterium levicorallinum]TFB83367.1 type II secretion system protein [Cryobacterium levicorallinum]GEP28710.1 hypothetical protein CLE01_33080 [Cryobacterium levicorallinum]SFH97263.1 hypothetical protein SAMN05216274_1257 [Cryobacterium levicorallinum]
MTDIIPVGPRRRETGFTLVELVIYISLSVLILSLVGGFLLNAVRAQRDVVSSSDGANTAQLIAESIKRDVRNATEVAVSGNLLVVRTAGMDDTSDLSCRAWYFDSGVLYTVNTGDARVTAPAPEGLKDWTVQGQGISAVNLTEPVFSVVVQGQVKLSFTVGGTMPVVVHTTVTQRAPSSIEKTCFAD